MKKKKNEIKTKRISVKGYNLYHWYSEYLKFYYDTLKDYYINDITSYSDSTKEKFTSLGINTFADLILLDEKFFYEHRDTITYFYIKSLTKHLIKKARKLVGFKYVSQYQSSDIYLISKEMLFLEELDEEELNRYIDFKDYVSIENKFTDLEIHTYKDLKEYGMHGLDELENFNQISYIMLAIIIRYDFAYKMLGLQNQYDTTIRTYREYLQEIKEVLPRYFLNQDEYLSELPDINYKNIIGLLDKQIFDALENNAKTKDRYLCYLYSKGIHDRGLLSRIGKSKFKYYVNDQCRLIKKIFINFEYAKAENEITKFYDLLLTVKDVNLIYMISLSKKVKGPFYDYIKIVFRSINLSVDLIPNYKKLNETNN